MNETFIQFVVSPIITAGFIFLTTYLAGRRSKRKELSDAKKVDAESHNLYVNDEINLANFYKQDIKDLRKMYDDLDAKYKSLTETLSVMQKDKEGLVQTAGRLADENAEYKRRVEKLEDEVEHLKAENLAYKKTPDAAAAIIHTKVDEALKEIKEQ